jgi:hypothetical protein
MTRFFFALPTVVLITCGSVAFAQQQQYDSLGSPTPAPQTATPGMTGPNIPIPGGAAQKDGYNITPSAQGLSTERPAIAKPNGNSTTPEGTTAGPILADPHQPATTGQRDPLKSPNAPLADD